MLPFSLLTTPTFVLIIEAAYCQTDFKKLFKNYLKKYQQP
jgi:hypothetical protein